MTEYEFELLEVLNGDREAGPWGAWVSVCLEFLQGAGYVTPGPTHKITDAGKAALAEYRLDHALTPEP